MDCLDDSELRALLATALPPERDTAVQEHVTTCDRCQGAVSALMASTLPAASDGPERILPGGTTIGRFFVLELVGTGGMGQVYSAYDPQLDRKVALKRLRAERLGAPLAESQSRLLREAKAMAKLSHPNVVTVFDVGVFDDQLFLTMDFVQGHTLSEWMRATDRSWSETLSVLIHAGRGLAAAHAAGLVHRDFKPANVLVGEDGRVQVTDFGLARPAFVAVEAADTEASPSPEAPMDALTRPGTVAGTPAYTAPERHDGAPADARSDQFSFCVTLYEALYGERPHAGTTYPELVRAMREGAIRAAPDGVAVPTWLRQRILRGLEADPARRYPTMEALLAVLVVDVPKRRPRRMLAAALAVSMMAAGAVWMTVDRQSRLCTGAEARLAGTWDLPTEERLREAFTRLGEPWAVSAWHRVRPSIDAYARSWVAEHTDACEAAQVRREQSEAVMDLRMMCLERRRRELHALTRLFSSPDQTIAVRAQNAVLNLPPIASCGDVETLLATVAPPSDRGTRSKVEALRVKLADARALLDSGKFKEAATAALALTAAARETGYSPVLAEVLYVAGTAQVRAGPYKDAHEHLLEAAQLAEVARHDEVAAGAWTELVMVTGGRLVRFEEALQWHTVATAAVARAGLQRGLIGARLESNVGALHMGKGNFASALEHMKRALEIYEHVQGPRHPLVAQALYNLSIALDLVGRRDESLAATQRALAIREAIFGDAHPEVAQSYDQLGFRLYQQRRFDEARPYGERAVAVGRTTHAPALELADYLSNLALVEKEQGRFDAAESLLLEALALRERGAGPEHPQVGVTLSHLGMLDLDRGRVSAALTYLRRSHALLGRVLGEDHPVAALALAYLGVAQHTAGNHAAAEKGLRRALSMLEAKQGPEHEWVIEAVAGLGRALHARRRSEEALRYLERASTAAGKGLLEPSRAIVVDFELAEALVASGGSRERAISLATSARQRAGDDARHAALRARMDAWLKRNSAL